MKKKYTASEWLRTCGVPKGPDHAALDHAGADAWYHKNGGDGANLALDYNDSYSAIAEAAESAEYGERAIGLKPVRLRASVGSRW